MEGSKELGVFLIQSGLFIMTMSTLWRIFSKAGHPGWAAFIPVYNAVVFLKICKKPIWWIALLFVPVLNIIFSSVLVFNMGKQFGKSHAFSLGMVLLPFIFYPILAFNSDEYLGNIDPTQKSEPQPESTLLAS